MALVLVQFHQYYVVGRGWLTPMEEHPRIYRMKLRVMFRCAPAILVHPLMILLAIVFSVALLDINIMRGCE